MGFKCIFGHKWQKLGGPSNVGSGRFKQMYKCAVCGKVKEVVS